MTSTDVAPGVEVFFDAADFELEHGARIDGLRLGYKSYGPVDAPLCVVLGGISANAHVCSDGVDRRPGWWQDIVGERRAIDLTRFRVIGIDWLGGCGASSGPADGAALFSPVSSRDQARALRRLLVSLGCDRAHAIVGASYGGMVALAFAREFPDAVDRIACLCAAHRSDPHTTAARALARRVLRFGLQVSGGRSGPELDEALSIARGLGMLSYRTREEFSARFDRGFDFREQGGIEYAHFEPEDYLEARGRDFAERYSAGGIHTLSQSIDLHDVDPSSIEVDAHIAATPSDRLVHIDVVRELVASYAGSARFEEIDSIYGHDAFLKEVDQVSAFVRASVEGPELAASRLQTPGGRR